MDKDKFNNFVKKRNDRFTEIYKELFDNRKSDSPIVRLKFRCYKLALFQKLTMKCFLKYLMKIKTNSCFF